MISKERINYESSRLYSLAELIDTTHSITYEAVNEGSDSYDDVLQRVHELLFAAYEVAHRAAEDVSDLIAECGEAEDQTGLTSEDLRVLGLHASTERILRRHNINIIRDLTAVSVLDLLRLDGIGSKSIADIKERLGANGLVLGGGAA